MDGLTPERRKLVKRYCQSGFGGRWTWANERALLHRGNIREEYAHPEPMQSRNARALALADEADAAAIRRAVRARPWPLAP